MDSTDLARVERKARLAYELSRLRRALLGFAPMVVIVVIAVLLGHHPTPSLVFGAGLFAFGVVLLWYGHDVKRAVLPGIAGGIVPLLFTLCAKHLHACKGGVCISLCVPVCVVGGAVAGAIVAAVGIRGRRGVAFWLAGSGITLFTGAMGCVCAGPWGIVGLTAGYLVGGAPGLVASLRAPSKT